MVQQKMDKNRHYSVLLGGDNNNIRIKVACGSGADVSISQVLNQGQGEMRRWWRASGPAGSFSKRGLDGFTGRTKPIFSPRECTSHLGLGLGVFVKELEEDTINVSGGGPLLVDCSQHGAIPWASADTAIRNQDERKRPSNILAPSIDSLARHRVSITP